MLLLIWAIISNTTSCYVLPYSIGVVFSFISYFILGNALYNCNINKRSLPILFIATTLLVIFTVIYRNASNSAYTLDPYKAFFTPSVSLLSIMIFLCFKVSKVHISSKLLADITFYIYLVHTPVYLALYKLFDFKFFKVRSIYIMTITICTFFISIVLSVIWQKLRLQFHNKLSDSQ